MRLNLPNSNRKAVVGFATVEFHVLLFPPQLIHPLVNVESASVCDVGTKTPSVHIVCLNVENFEIVATQQFFDSVQRIVLKVFVSDIVKPIFLEHCPKIVLLYHPNALWSNAFHDILDEIVWLIKIIKHRDAGYDLGLLSRKFLTKRV